MKTITPCLWFEKDAEKAADFYVSIFNGIGRKSKIGAIAKYTEESAKASGQALGSVMTVTFELDDSKFMALNGGPVFRFSQAVSFMIECKTQEEIDYFWEKLGDGGETGVCGWINRDKFGISWQVVPEILGEITAKADPETLARVMKAILGMKKIDIASLRRAYEGVPIVLG